MCIADSKEGKKRARWRKRSLLYEGFYALVTACVSIFFFFGSWFF